MDCHPLQKLDLLTEVYGEYLIKTDDGASYTIEITPDHKAGYCSRSNEVYSDSVMIVNQVTVGNPMILSMPVEDGSSPNQAWTSAVASIVKVD